MVWERKTHRGKASFLITLCQGHMLSTWFMTTDINIGHPTGAVFVRFLHCKITLSSPSHTQLFENKLTHSPHSRAGGTELHLMEEVISTQIISSSFVKMCLFFLYVYSFNHLHQYGLIFILLIRLKSSITITHFIAQTHPALAIGELFQVGSCVT